MTHLGGWDLDKTIFSTITNEIKQIDQLENNITAYRFHTLEIEESGDKSEGYGWYNLEYELSDDGLNNVEWEGGRTEYEFADINNDGFVDILTIGDHGSPRINTNQHGVMVFFGDGTGSWDVVMSGDFGYGGIAVGDINNDGDWDVGYADHHPYTNADFGNQMIEVALGDGSGENWEPWDYD